MSIPLKVLNRLHLGRPVAAPITPTRPGYRAWVHIVPLIDSARTPVIKDSENEWRMESSDGSAILGYRLRHLEVLELLLSQGVDTKSLLKDETTTDHFVFADNEQELERLLIPFVTELSSLRTPSIVDYPLSDTARPLSVGETLCNAAMRGDIDFVKEMLDAGVDVNTPIGVTVGYPSISSTNLKDTPIVYAAWEGKVEMVRFLLQRGADIHANHEVALWRAALSEHTEIVKILLDRGADVNANDLLHYCRCLEIADCLLARGAKITQCDSVELLSRANKKDNLEVVLAIIDRGVKVNVRDQFGRTALMEASSVGNLELVQVLIHAGAKVNLKDYSGNTALTLAQKWNRKEIVALLEATGVKQSWWSIFKRRKI